MPELIIYGASDDLLEVDGLIEDEFDVYGPTTVIITDPNGAKIAVTASFDEPEQPLRDHGDGWQLSVHHANSDWTHPIRLGARPDRDSDPAIILDVPEGTTVELLDGDDEDAD